MYFVQESRVRQMMNQLSVNAIPNVEALDPCKERYLLNQVSLAWLPRKEWISTQTTCGTRLQGPLVHTQTTCGNQLQDKSVYTWVTYSNLL